MPLSALKEVYFIDKPISPIRFEKSDYDKISWLISDETIIQCILERSETRKEAEKK